MYDLYQEAIMDHYRYPRHSGVIQDPHLVSRQYNPSCGDKTCVTALIHNNVITEIKAQAVGCVITIAATSMVAEQALHKKIDELLEMKHEILLAELGISLGPTRLKCALLPFYALCDGIKQYQTRKQ